MDIDDALALIGEERPAWWIQYRDGAWAPVWRDGQVGPSFTISQLIQLATDDIAALDAGLVARVIDGEPLGVVDAESGQTWPQPRKVADRTCRRAHRH
ncbi:hypothetical protein HLB23_10385 [Nocardia uniformis]|uniref:Uncharacterized protein n=1 Tax=Nocardia uniformis TaxID=53432 RepID=A0A849C1N3_9NOCA|nr:hypothetical protein [Nocardia uniformis]NNH70265.1 hypothetical protein [Nocardia uniformis]